MRKNATYQLETLFLLLGIVLTYMASHLIIAKLSKVQSRLYGCNERLNDAHIAQFELTCGSDFALANYFETLIDIGFGFVTFSTGLVVIIFLVLIQLISLALSFFHRRS